MDNSFNLEIDNYINAGLENGSIRLCPFCKVPGELASGCNYIKCPMPDCQKEWCWLCGNPKYNSSIGLPACNDPKHNSH